MAIYTTFFLADPEQLAAGFPAWKPPLPAPVRREWRNPFTKQLVTFETREPEWPDQDQPTAARDYHVTPIEGCYEDYLEARLPPFVRGARHWAAKGLTDIEIEPLLGLLGVTPELECPLYAPPASGAILRAFPPQFLPTLRAADPAAVARDWAAAMSTPEHTHSATGHKLSDGWTPADATQILEPLLALARAASPRQRMYLLIEA